MSGEDAVDSSAVHDVEVGKTVAVEVGKCGTRAMGFGIVVGPGSTIEVAEFDPGLGRDLAESREGKSRFLIIAAARQNGCRYQSNSQQPTEWRGTIRLVFVCAVRSLLCIVIVHKLIRGASILRIHGDSSYSPCKGAVKRV